MQTKQYVILQISTNICRRILKEHVEGYLPSEWLPLKSWSRELQTDFICNV